MSPRAKLWLALWAVYLIWGSTYLGIALAGETIPPVFAAGVRFVLAGLLMAALVLWRRGRAPFRIGRAEFVSAAVVGVLLPGANALLFVAERDVPTGLASLVIGSVPLWIVLMRTIARDRPNTAAIAGTAVGFAGLALLVRPQGGATVGGMLLVLGSAIMWSLGSFLSARLPLPADALAATTVEMLVGGLVLLPAGVALALAQGESLDPATFSARSIGGFVYLVVFGSLVGLHGVRVAARQRPDRDRGDVRVREPGRGHRARRARARRVDHVDDRGRRGADPRLGRSGDPAGRGVGHLVRAGRGRPGARARAGVARRVWRNSS